MKDDSRALTPDVWSTGMPPDYMTGDEGGRKSMCFVLYIDGCVSGTKRKRYTK